MNVLFYDDSPVFGGHEVMALAGLEAVLSAASTPVRFLASHANAKLVARLHEMAVRHPQLTVETLAWESSKIEAARNLFLPFRVRRLADRFRALAPSLVVAVQGNIEHSSLALQAAKCSGIRCFSYIPVPHTNQQMGAKLGALRDLFCARLFLLPDAFITITDEMARLLVLRGARCPVRIVYNGVDTQRFQPGDRTAARRLLGLPEEPILLGVVGRIEFRQKQQHLLVQAMASEPTLAARSHLVFAGDGPDAAALRDLLDRHSVSGTVLPWCDPSPLYRALDALVIPSRYEGLPLVMLEALATGITVFGSDRDGMKDFLPSDCRFHPEQPAALASCLTQWVQHGLPAPDLERVRQVREEMSLEAFATHFRESVTPD
jgi:glycosyltransferase involved in cell wall biosynthesis